MIAKSTLRSERSGGTSLTVLLSLTLALGILVICLTASAFFYGRYTRAQPPQAVFTSTGPTVERLESMGHLTVLKLAVADVLEGEGYGYRGAWLIRGDAFYTIDMRNAKLEPGSKDEAQKKATILLPLPVVNQARLDHNKTLTYKVEKTTSIPFSGDQNKLRDESMKKAQQEIEKAAAESDYVDVAKLNGELIIKNMYKLVDCEITIKWDSPKKTSQIVPAPK